MMKIGFTGTRKGMTDAQKLSFERWIGVICLERWKNVEGEVEESQVLPVELHHGCCVGADTEAHETFLAVMGVVGNTTNCITVLHPPSDPHKIDGRFQQILMTTSVYGANYHTGNPVRVQRVYRPAPYLMRNHAIVDQSDMLVATPAGDQEVVRSGTWATIRYARKLQKPLMIIWPDGIYKTVNLWSANTAREELKK